MGVVLGKLIFINLKLGYDFLKEYCESNQIELAFDYPEVKMISTMNIPELKITNDNGIEIKKLGREFSVGKTGNFQLEYTEIEQPNKNLDDKRYFISDYDLEKVRNTQLYRTLLHEFGHYIYYLETMTFK